MKFAGRAAPAAVAPERVEQACALVERFLYELGSSFAGEDSELAGCMTGPALADLAEALGPYREGDVLLHPDFGSHAELRISEDGDGVCCAVRFTDRSRDPARPTEMAASRAVCLELRLTAGLDAVAGIECTVGD